jgi:ribosomal-protein-serine acetyltransferase
VRKMGVEIRRLSEEDTPAMWEAAAESVEAVYPWMEWCHPGITLEEVAAYTRWAQDAWERDESYSFVIVEQQTGTIVGGAGLSQVQRQHGMANLFYWVRSSYVGRGAATVATRLLARYGLETLGLQRIEIVASVQNLASQRVAEKAGAHREGVLRKRVLLHGTPHDAVMYSLVREDYSS